MTTKIFHELQEIKQRLNSIEEHFLIDAQDDPFMQAKQHNSQIIVLLRIMKGRASAIPTEIMVQKAERKGIDKKTTLQCLELMRRTGEIFRPKRGFVQKL